MYAEAFDEDQGLPTEDEIPDDAFTEVLDSDYEKEEEEEEEEEF